MAQSAAARQLGSRPTLSGLEPRTHAGEAPAPQSFPAVPEPLPLARFSAAEDLRGAIATWVDWLAGERRASPHTVAAYGRDLAFFLDFLTEHLGEPPALASFATLSAADFRAWLKCVRGKGQTEPLFRRGRKKPLRLRNSYNTDRA